MEAVASRHEDAPGGAAAAPAETFSSDGASRDSTGDEIVSIPDDSPVGSLDEDPRSGTGFDDDGGALSYVV